jgi:hypothetical protein
VDAEELYRRTRERPSSRVRGAARRRPRAPARGKPNNVNGVLKTLRVSNTNNDYYNDNDNDND